MIEKRYTIKDIAREAGVSPALVSFALNNGNGANGERKYKVNEETARRIIAIARQHNFTPNNAARSLRSRRSRTIGVILSDISNSFFSDIARRIEDKAFAANYSILFGSTDEKPKKLEKIISTFLDKGIDSLIIVPCEKSGKIIGRLIEERKIPTVLLDREADGIATDRIVLDNEKAGEMAVKALYDGGFRRIALLSYGMKLSNIAQREAGYRKAMSELGLQERIAIVRADYNDLEASVQREIGSMDFTRTDALIFATNSLAVAGLKAMNGRGISTPKDVGVVAFDDSDAFDLYPSTVARIRQPLEQFAQEALELAIRRIASPEVSASTRILAPELVDGASAHKA